MSKPVAVAVPGARPVASGKFARSRLLPLAVLLHVLAQPAWAQSLPPDPGKSGLSTLAGIDSNSDGVRDDIERIIAETFHGERQLERAVSNLAIAFQHAIAATSAAESREAHSMMLRASECALALGARAAVYRNELLELDGLMVNTPERKRAYEEHAARIAKDTFAVRKAFRWDASCARRVDQVAGGNGWPPATQ